MVRPSVFSNVYYQQLLWIVGVAGCVVPPIIVGLSLLVRQGTLDNRFYAGDAVFYPIAIGFLACTAANFYYVMLRRSPPLGMYILFAVGFHMLAVCFLLFVSGVYTPFLFGWVLLALSVDVYFGTPASLASIATLCGTVFCSALLYPVADTQSQATLIGSILLIIATIITISRIRTVNDRARHDLSQTHNSADIQKERLLALINSMGDAVITTDDSGIISVYNAATLSLLDTNINLQGRNIDDILQLKDEHQLPVLIMAEARKRRRVFSRTDLSHVFEDGETLKIYVNVSPVQPGYQARGESGYIFILRDITKEKSLEEERDEFISVVSHELRTPVAIAEGTVSNLMLMQERGADKTVTQAAAKDAHDQIMYLAKLVNDLSTLSRAERGVGAEAEVIDLNTLIQEIYKEYAPQASAKGLSLDLHMPDKLPRMRTSRLYLEEILHNFITNALKYTQEGSITLEAVKKGGDVQIAVADTGIGISKFDQRHIFQKFYRSEDYRTRETSGTGLGLYVCKKLAEKLRVKLSFESRLNHGSTFSILIPKDQFTDQKATVAGPAGFVAAK